MTITSEVLLLALFLFALRVINSAVGTLRLILMARGLRILTAILGFIEALIFAYVTTSVVTDFSNVPNLVAYCGGFSVGIWAGMAIEERFVTNYVKVNVIASLKGREIAVALREIGHGVTEVQGTGGKGEVIMLNSVVKRRDVPGLLQSVYGINPNAFVTLEETRGVQHGWMRNGAPR
jgi:uncharacterized protein YebE (UPF0316 family)